MTTRRLGDLFYIHFGRCPNPGVRCKPSRRGHKLVFIPEAVVCRHHVDTQGSYLRRKFYVGYWRVLMCRKHPDKIWRHWHTPQLLEVQVVLGLALAIPAPIVRGYALWTKVAFLAGFLGSTIPFCVEVLSQDRLVRMISPLLLFLRAEILGIGLAVGFPRRLTGG